MRRTRLDGLEGGIEPAANRPRQIAPRGIAAAFRHAADRRDLSSDDVKRFGVAVAARNRSQQGLCIRVSRASEKRMDVGDLDDAASLPMRQVPSRCAPLF